MLTAMKLAVASTLFSLLVACTDHHAATPNNEPPSNTSTSIRPCGERAAELKLYLTQVFDPNAKPKPPWPIGDPELDKQLDARRDDLRKLQAETPADKARPLASGLKRGPMDETLDGCPQARDAVAHIADFPEPDHLTKAANAIGDGVAACGCTVNIPLLRAGFYLMARGPD
jgi:hypothetical protein